MSQLQGPMVLSPASETLDEASEGAKQRHLGHSITTLPVPMQQIKNTLPRSHDSEFYRNTSLSSHFSLPSFKKQSKNNWGFENIT